MRALQLSSRGLVSAVDRDAAETRLKVMEANYQAAVDGVRALKASLQDRRAAYELDGWRTKNRCSCAHRLPKPRASARRQKPRTASPVT